ncbi:unnamed protein product [Gongylonema pulchrum]|uniref:Uncharacterized protein n=1 Tax=Gongylonema pulchrum TaxID=637853 RepID=A0A3P6SSH6_9BILA|nr:unnamed protein product [Gongylonema pulchrum]
MVGNSDEYLSEDRWVFNMISCFTSRGSSAAYCYGHFDPSMEYWNALGLCIPANCTFAAKAVFLFPALLPIH